MCTCDEKIVKVIARVIEEIREEHPESNLSDYRIVVKIVQLIMYNMTRSFMPLDAKDPFNFIISAMGDIIGPFIAERVRGEKLIIEISALNQEEGSVH